MKITSFEIENFKSLEKISVDSCQDFHVFIGANSAGKTSIFDAINIIKNTGQKISNPEIISNGIGEFESKRIKLRLTITLDEDERVEYLTHHFHISEELVTTLSCNQVLSHVNLELTINIYGSKANNQYGANRIFPSKMEVMGDSGYVSIISYNNENDVHIRPNPRGKKVTVNNFNNEWNAHGWSSGTIDSQAYLNENSFHGRFLKDLSENLRYVEAIRETHKKIESAYFDKEDAIGERGERLPNFMETLWANQDDYYQKIENYCKAIFPNIEKIRAKKLPNNQITIEIHKKNIEVPITLDGEGRGLDQALVVIWRIATSPKNSIWLIDEPEIHLHPGAQKLLYEFFQDEVARDKQIIVSTHSMVFIHRCKEQQVSVLLYRDGLTELSPIKNIVDAETSSEQNRDNIRNIVYESLGYDSSQSLEYTTVVAVEGKTDIEILKIFGYKLGIPFDEKTTLFVPVGNKDDAERFTPVLKYAVSKRTFIILDNDYQNPSELKQSIKSKEKEYMKKIGLEKNLLKEEEFCFYDEDVYSIESYLLNSEAIGKIGDFNSDQIEEIEKRILKEKTKPKEEREKPKKLLSNIWSDFGLGPYNDESPAKIANHMEEIDILKFPELLKIIKKINKRQ